MARAMQAETLPDAAAARAYYDARYAAGYMDRWEAERHDRLREVLATIQLPARPRILDYGCGSGSLTALLAACWPDAQVVGVDVSATAVAHARQRHRDPRLQFATLDAAFVREAAGTFDFVFSHHVLEHVFDLDASLAELARLLAPSGRMLHVLPCGNAGSFSHWLCQRRPDGIAAAAGHRFYFEEPSHLRRLRSDELAARFAAHGVALQTAWFGYHWLGAVRLFTELSPRDLLVALDPRPWRRASWPWWLPVACGLLLLCALRAPAQVLVRVRRLWQQATRLRTRRLGEPRSLCLLALAVPALCLWPVSWLVESAVRALDHREWRRRRRDPRGTEMLLTFTRQPAADPATPGPLRQPAAAAGPALATVR